MKASIVEPLKEPAHDPSEYVSLATQHFQRTETTHQGIRLSELPPALGTGDATTLPCHEKQFFDHRTDTRNNECRNNHRLFRRNLVKNSTARIL
jgi:hypothetical protein